VGLTEHAVNCAQQQLRPIAGRYYDRNRHPQFSNSPAKFVCVSVFATSPV
jgi:hypothetical protein